MPCNRDIQELLLNKSHLKVEHDIARYEVILRHFVIWSSLESALEDGTIEDYDAGHVLSFPVEDVDRHYEAAERLIHDRDELLRRMQTVAWRAYRERDHHRIEKGDKA